MVSEKVKDLLQKNEAYASSNYTPPPDWTTMTAGGSRRNQATIIVACPDPRQVPEHFFGFGRDEMPVIRVAGGRARHALRDLLVINDGVGLGRIVVIHHTDCYMSHEPSEHFAEAYKKIAPQNTAEIDAIDFDAIKPGGFDASIKSDIKFLKEQPYFWEGIEIVGMVLDIQTGRVRVVE